MSNVIPLRGKRETAREVLARIAEDTGVVGIVLMVFKNEELPSIVAVGVDRPETAFAGAYFTNLAVTADDAT